MKRLAYFIVLIDVSMLLFGQTDTTSNQGQVVSGEVIIEKNKTITLFKAEKIFQKGELKTFESDSVSVRLTSNEPELLWPAYKSDVPFMKTNNSYPISSYTNYVRLGYGNYNSPVAEVGISEKLSDFAIRSKLFYESFKKGPVNGTNSENSIGQMDLAATYTSDALEIRPFLSYLFRGYRWYGNTNRLNTGFNEDAPELRWNDFNLGVSLQGKAESISYELASQFLTSTQKLTNDRDINSENVFKITGAFDYKIDNHFSAGFELNGASSTYKGGITYDRSLFLLNPWLSYKRKDFSIVAGFNVATTQSIDTDFSGFYPNIKGEWDLNDGWTFHGELLGNIGWNDLSDLLSQNEFLDDSLSIQNSETKIAIAGGVKGALVKNLVLNVNLRYANIDHLPLFIPSFSDSSRYFVTYDDESIDRITLDAEVSYTPTNRSTYVANLEVNSYSTNSLDKPWHLPTFVFEVYSIHNFKEKVIVSAKSLVMGGIQAPTAVGFGIADLSTFLDVSLGIKYLINQRASAFIETENLLNDEYERYLGYPVRGVSFKIGGQYRF